MTKYKHLTDSNKREVDYAAREGKNITMVVNDYQENTWSVKKRLETFDMVVYAMNKGVVIIFAPIEKKEIETQD